MYTFETEYFLKPKWHFLKLKKKHILFTHLLLSIVQSSKLNRHPFFADLASDTQLSLANTKDLLKIGTKK